jgi:hypothetical protein
MPEPQERHWRRKHQNGQIASVTEHGERDFSASTSTASGEGGIAARNIRTLEAAQANADRQSKCPYPCKCKPWFQDV